jgi:hypothetical protein
VSAMQVTANQIKEFFALASKSAVSYRDLTSLAKDVATNAKLAELGVKRYFDLSLSMDPAGVRLLDQLLDAMHSAAVSQMRSEPNAALCTSTLGAYFGEFVRSQIGGTWTFAAFKETRYVALTTGYGMNFAVMQRTGRQFLHGREDSVMFFYSFLRLTVDRFGKFGDLTSEEISKKRDEIVARLKARRAKNRCRGQGS